MHAFFQLCCATAVALSLPGASSAGAKTLNIVAAENFYADIAAQIGGESVSTRAILTNPDQDPHLFEASPSVASDLQSADLVILNGAGYDEWMAKLLAATPQSTRQTLNVGMLTGAKNGDNPHLWYDLGRIDATGREIAARLSALDPANTAQFAANLAKFTVSLADVRGRIDRFTAAHAGAEIIASEPVFGYMASALNLKMHGEKFALAIMNNSEPAVSDVAGFESDLTSHRVAALLFNAQASSPTVDRLKSVALAAHIPIVAITETEPAGMSYQTWMTSQLDALDKALSAPK